MNIKGAIFDMDGTLIESMGCWRKAGDEYLIELGLEPPSGEKAKQMSLPMIAVYLEERYGIHKTKVEMVEAVKGRMLEHYKNDIEAKEGARELLQYLKEQGVKIALATATELESVEAVLKRTGLYAYMDEIVTCGMVGKGKYEPDVFDRAMERMGTCKEDTLVFEDALYAVTTAKRAGYKVMGIFDPYEAGREEMRELADYYVQDLREAKRLLENG